MKSSPALVSGWRQSWLGRVRGRLAEQQEESCLRTVVSERVSLYRPLGRCTFYCCSDSGTFLGLGTVTGSVAIYIAFSLQVMGRGGHSPEGSLG